MMKEVEFQKMEGAGNDFVVIDNRKYKFSLDDIIAFTPKLCDRKFGIGADGLLVLQPSEKPDVDYTMIYRNADGSDAGMCGNGGRCLALFAANNGFKNSHTFNVHENLYKAEVSEEEVSIHFPVEVSPSPVSLNGENYIRANAATEHLIKFVSEETLRDEKFLVETGSRIRHHPEVNPPGTNVNFVQQIDKHLIKVQTFERGVENLTLACGTGALASAIASHMSQDLQEEHSTFEIQMEGGTLKAEVNYNKQNSTYFNLILTGPANFVFKGSITLS